MSIYVISIDGDSGSWAIFSDKVGTCVKEFTAYQDEASALAEGKAWCAERSDLSPEIVYPRVAKIVRSYVRGRL